MHARHACASYLFRRCHRHQVDSELVSFFNSAVECRTLTRTHFTIFCCCLHRLTHELASQFWQTITLTHSAHIREPILDWSRATHLTPNGPNELLFGVSCIGSRQQLIPILSCGVWRLLVRSRIFCPIKYCLYGSPRHWWFAQFSTDSDWTKSILTALTNGIYGPLSAWHGYKTAAIACQSNTAAVAMCEQTKRISNYYYALRTPPHRIFAYPFIFIQQTVLNMILMNIRSRAMCLITIIT